MSKRIAIIGSGISGLVSAYLLNKKHQVVLFEANDYLGGHTSTIDVTIENQQLAIDTGFIVFNQKTYPDFCRLLEKLKVPTQKSEMSFSFRSSQLKLEYNGHNLNTMFANRRNLFSPRFYKMLADIVRFNKDAKAFLAERNNEMVTIEDFLKKNRYRHLFIEAYFIPMVSAIWSANPRQLYHTPARFILHFFENHGLLNIQDRPDWHVIKGGSRSYIAPIVDQFKSSVYLNTPVRSIERKPDCIVVKTDDANIEFDAIVIAAHSDQALKMIENPRQDELDILSAIPYQDNEVILHYDHKLLPKKHLARASWNYHHVESDIPTVTYYMNRLQSIDGDIDFCVSMNQSNDIDPHKIIKKLNYSHPVFNKHAIHAQKNHSLINGADRIYYCGAYWGYGFHEDGVKSALAACQSFEIGL